MFRHVSMWLAGLSAVALSAGLGYHVLAQNEGPKKEEPKPVAPKAEPKPGALDLDLDLKLNFDDFFKDLPPGVDVDALKKALEMRNQFQFQGGGFGGFPGVGPLGRFAGRSEGRLGVMAQKPSDTLVEQLDLPRNQGLVVTEVVADSAAAKAGLKVHDVLLELDGKPVPDNLVELKKAVDEIKADTPVDVVVMRKGKKETVKGVKLPEPKPAANVGGFGGFGPGNFQFQFGPGAFGGGGAGTMTSVMRNNDQFQVKQTENGLMVSVSGSIDAGKAKATEIQVIEPGKAAQTFDSLDKVPDAYKEKVKTLIDIAEKGKVEIKKP